MSKIVGVCCYNILYLLHFFVTVCIFIFVHFKNLYYVSKSYICLD